MGFRNHVLLAVLLVIVFAPFLDPAPVQPSLLCHKTDYVDICSASVTANIKGKPTRISVLNAEIYACAKGTKAALAQVVKLFKLASKDNLVSAVNRLTKATKVIGAPDIGTLNSSAAITFCGNAYTESSSSLRLMKMNKGNVFS